MMSLQILESLPCGMVDLPAPKLHEVLDGPTLIEIEGDRHPGVFVSVLLHGNEVGGWDAVRRLLKSLQGRSPQRAMSLFVGNVQAARAGVRHLDDQPDFNRVWNGHVDHPLADTARRVTEHMRAKGCFASIDIHNNSGVNPCHVCISKLDWYTLRVGSMFAPVTVLVDYPSSIQTAAFSDFCPSVTLEAGRIGDGEGISRTFAMLESMLAIDSLDDVAVGDGSGASLYRTLARIELPSNCQFEFASDPDEPALSDISLSTEIESRNFELLPKGTFFARLPCAGEPPLVITSRQGEVDVEEYFEVRGDSVRLARDLIFSMYTTRAESVRQDCLCYLMESIALHRLARA